VPTPVAQGLLSIASVVADRDLYAQGRTLENLGLAGLDRQQMTELLTTGAYS
jgi:opine dehydrogenase